MRTTTRSFGKRASASAGTAIRRVISPSASAQSGSGNSISEAFAAPRSTRTPGPKTRSSRTVSA